MKNFKYKVLLLLTLLAGAVHAWADPPARVGRIAYIEGNVEFRNLASEESGPAALNWPVTSNTMISTGDRSRAEFRVGSAAVRLDANSELEIVQLDDARMILRLNRGAAIANVRDSSLADEFEFDTPRGSVRLDEPSDIRVDVGDAPNAGSVQVFSGRARYDDSDSGMTIAAGHRAEISEEDIRLTENHSNGSDFDQWSMARDRSEEASASVRYVSPETTGYEELDRYGDWHVTAEYGALWYPRAVPAGWAPYRVGRWVWVEPWGWTWVDSEPWGYAPSHYGRWVWYGRRWCWAPGRRVAEPVWAPALVGWVGGNGWNASFSTGSAPAVGWFPLAPHEAYVPSYRVSPNYIRQINITHVANINNIRYVKGQPSMPMRTHYRNRGLPQAVTVLPRNRFERGGDIAISTGIVQHPPRQAWRNAPVSATVPPDIKRPSFGGDGRRTSSRFNDGAREISTSRVLPAQAVSPASSARFHTQTPAEIHRHMPEILSRPQPAAPPRPSPAMIPRAIAPHEYRRQPDVFPSAPQAATHEAPQMPHASPRQPPALVREGHGFAPPVAGMQAGSIDRIHEAPANREMHRAFPPPPDADHHGDKPGHGRREGERHRGQEQGSFRR